MTRIGQIFADWLNKIREHPKHPCHPRSIKKSSDMAVTPRNPVATFLIKEPTVLSVIVLNAVVLFLNAFPSIKASTYGVLHWIDYGCMVFFVIEAAIKIRRSGFQGYWQNGWNKMDFFIVVISLPLLASPFFSAALEDFAVLLLLRLGRLLRFSRVMRSIPHAAEVWRGVIRALRASVAVFMVLFALNLILAMGANILFHDAAPEHFGDPLIAFYSLFKVFTIEGWYEIPEALDPLTVSGGTIFLMRGYFVVSVLVGGLLGLSMANAVFVDEMTADNTDNVERMVAELHEELQAFREEMRQARRPL